jgi:hypothetical protein
VKLPGHHQKVVMVKAVICISTGSGAEDPPGGQDTDSSSTVMTTKACYLSYISSSQARVTLLYLKRDCVRKLARRSLLNAKGWQDKSSLDGTEERKHVEVLPVGEELGRNIGDKEYVLIETAMRLI